MYQVVANGHTKYFGVSLEEMLKTYYTWVQAGSSVQCYRWPSYYYQA